MICPIVYNEVHILSIHHIRRRLNQKFWIRPDSRVMTTKKNVCLLWDGMNFFIYKTKMGLILNFVKKSSPTKWLFCTSFFGHLLPTVSYCSKLCTDKSMGTMLLASWRLYQKKFVQNGQSGPEIEAIWCPNMKHRPLVEELNINCFREC